MSTNAEVIASFMEPIPKTGDYNTDDFSPNGWWKAIFQTEYCVGWTPCRLTLNECHEVEKKLQAGARDATEIEPCILRNRYIAALSEAVGNADVWHATAEQKIVALGQVLRRERSGDAGA